MMERSEDEQQQQSQYPIGRGYGHDYMRGGEVFGGYGYSARDAYLRRRGDDQTAPAGEAGDDEGTTPDAPSLGGRNAPESRDPRRLS